MLLFVLFNIQYQQLDNIFIFHKNINFFEFSWMIDIKSVRSISFDCFCLNSNGLWRTYSTFLASSPLVKSVHLHCYCTVHIYVVIHFCDSMWSFWVEANPFASLVYICIVLEIQFPRVEGWVPIIQFNPATYLYLNHGFTTLYVVVFFVFSEFSQD